jgi:hypothetical protein
MDRFKTYLQQHSQELDTDLPRGQVWDKIEKDLAPAPRRVVAPLYRKWAVAACAAALLGVLLWWAVPSAKQQAITAKRETTVPVPPPATPIAKPVPQPEPAKELPAKNDVAIINRKAREKNIHATPPQEKETPSESAMLHHLEAGFIQIISLQLDRVRSTPLYAEGPGYFSDFKKQFSQLDEDEQALKKNIQHNGLTDDRLDALINIYQQKIQVLKQLQNEINKTNKYYRKSQSAAAKPDFMNI